MKLLYKVGQVLSVSLLGGMIVGLAHAQVSVLNQPGTVIGSLSAQNWLSSTPTTLYTVPSGRTARVTDVIVWGGEIAAGHTCAIALYCSTSSGSNLVYFMAEAGKSSHYPFNNGIACGSDGNLIAYYYAPTTYSGAGSTCGNGGQGSNTPWLTLRGYLYTVP